MTVENGTSYELKLRANARREFITDCQFRFGAGTFDEAWRTAQVTLAARGLTVDELFNELSDDDFYAFAMELRATLVQSRARHTEEGLSF